MALAVVALIGGVTAWSVASGDGTSSHRAAEAGACSPSVGEPGSLAVGAPVPDFTLPTLDGGCVRLSDLRGRPVVVNFWASWCNPCRREFPLFRDALNRHHDDGLRVLGITHEDIASDSRQFAREQHASWPLLVDDRNTVADAYGVKAIPQTFFIRPDGTLAAHLYGLTSRRDLDAEIRLAAAR